MAEPFVAEIRIFPFTFAPRGWAFCDGQVLAINQNTALFALLGTMYGGDGKTTFALPDLRGSVPMHPGQGPGLSLHDLGEQGGSETVTLLASEIPVHSHAFNAASDPANTSTPNGGVALGRTSGATPYAPASPAPQTTPLAPEAVAPAGASQPHNNLMPYLVCRFNIALQGVFPPRG